MTINMTLIKIRVQNEKLMELKNLLKEKKYIISRMISAIPKRGVQSNTTLNGLGPVHDPRMTRPLSFNKLRVNSGFTKYL